MKYYALNRHCAGTWVSNKLHVGSGIFGHTTPEAAEKAALETASKYQDQVFVKVARASSSNEALKMA